MERIQLNQHMLNKRSGHIKSWTARRVIKHEIGLKRFQWFNIQDEDGDNYVPRSLFELSYNDNNVKETNIFNFKESNSDWYE